MVRCFLNLSAQLIGGLLVAQRDEKVESAKQRALTDAVRSEQRQEELNGFYKSKLPGNVYPLSVSVIVLTYFKYPRQMMSLKIWGRSRKTMTMNRTQ